VPSTQTFAQVRLACREAYLNAGNADSKLWKSVVTSDLLGVTGTCPAPAIATNSEPLIAPCTAFACRSGRTGSSVPQSTRVGTRTRRTAVRTFFLDLRLMLRKNPDSTAPAIFCHENLHSFPSVDEFSKILGTKPTCENVLYNQIEYPLKRKDGPSYFHNAPRQQRRSLETRSWDSK